MNRTVRRALATAVLAAWAAASMAATAYQSAADIPVEVFFKRVDYRSLSLSPDGKTLAAVVPLKTRGNLILIDIATRKAQIITSSERFDVASLEWVGNKFLLFKVADGQDASGRFNYKGAYYYDVEQAQVQELESTNGDKKNAIHITSILSHEGGDSPIAMVTMNGRSREFEDVYRFNFKTRRHQFLSFDSPGRTSGWVLDTKDRPRIAIREELRVAQGQAQMTTYWHLPVNSDKWEKLFESSSYNDGVSYHILGFDNDDRTLYVASNRDGRDKMAVYKYDTTSKQFGAVVAEDAVFDVDGESADARLIRDPDPKNRRVYGLVYQGLTPTRVWFGESPNKAMSAAIDATLPASYNTIRISENGSKALVRASSDVDAGSYYFYDAEKKSLEFLLKERDWVVPALMAERKPIAFKARDGLPIYGYLTTPRHTEAKNLPLIVNVHGGPMVRGYHSESWGRWPEAQFFASRGYAVLELEPRGSVGSGRKNYLAGWKQWGGTMQDDLSDGALFLVQEGIVDKQRMGLLGGSYGGYASLQGMVKNPELWQCADASVAVSDLGLLQSVTWSDTAEAGDVATGGYFANEFGLWVGDAKADAALFELRSPARNAQRIRGPIMLSMGSDDRRVPLIHGEKMRDAMSQAGKSLDYKVYAEEGHGFNRDVSVFDLYRRGEKFFADCLKKK
ncbi:MULTISPECIES: alpha/beta hydrolase family protein [unclassified Undibacterium]|uniref:alpha/beta hydrolase family protein n=1 Tax=unclassified Undibacterium TaxID=2630295 RepID=UPI002AC959CD|nr:MULTISPECIES: prolyl oligopeptidase family serine peptidase [unclassified Undibacterium]MEB0140079.1 prolyl oligopeptidase family serine peptidase [Undibacterium sp. CCC2.1]MEB0173189.1 prolyl oligopeptidase family serine peptidase [Undibacterium sp. CCC1.1]MEB0176884.1 prolyl oligopeptidase family serine peptidase [Undibacterium sp. CCC3.4]MEB0216203.1 prolyl oligopeptidase family serine peptidase [Undibacterium sp. 5I2]WPX41961.1 prolyl oligopeptidase family serine peptidase [Undibacteriu